MENKPVKPFRIEVFLVRMLACIFLVEAIYLGYGIHSCFNLKDPEDYLKVCPNLAGRVEKLFGVAVATTLSLLAGNKIISK